MATTNPPELMHAAENTVSRLQVLLDTNRRTRRRENWINAAKFIAVSLLVSWFFGFLYAMYNGGFPEEHILFPLLSVVSAIFMVAFAFTLHCLLYWGLYCLPFLVYLWAGIWAVRQRTVLSLIQASAETKIPLAGMIRAYACDCFSPPFRKRLKRFALMLERGYTLEQAANLDRGLVHYDIIGMLWLGGNNPATLQSMENSAYEEREYSPIRSIAAFRFAYILSIIFPFLFIIFFMMTKIAPQFKAIFTDFGTTLPSLTATVFQIFNYYDVYGFGVGLLIALFSWGAVIFIFLQIVKTNVVAWRPLFFRSLFREIDSSKLLRVLSVGLNHQVPLPQILQAYRHTVPSRYLQKKAVRIEHNILEGKDWLIALRKENIITRPESSLLETARRTGNMTTVLEQIAVSKERSQLRKDDLTSKLIFIPCLMALAAIIGIFVIAMFLPLVNLIEALT